MIGFFPIGVTYGGTLPRGEWKDDFREIHEAGFNCVKISSGACSPDDLDYILDLAAEHEIKVLVDLREPEWDGSLLRRRKRRQEAEALYREDVERLRGREEIAAWIVSLPEGGAEAAEWKAQVVRSLDASRPVVMEASFGDLPQTSMPICVCCDAERLPPSCSVYRQKEMYIGYVLRCAGSAASDADVWAAALQAGPTRCHLAYGPLDVSLAAWSAIAHGARGLIFDRWDPEPMRGSIKGIDGKCWPGLKRMSADFCRFAEAPGILLGRPEVPQAAVLVSRGIGGRAAPGTHEGAYRLLVDNQVSVDFLDEHATLQDLQSYAVIYAPWVPVCAQEFGDILANYVRQGGALIAEFPLAVENEEGQPYTEPPGAGLAEVFGCRFRGGSNEQRRAPAAATTGIAQGMFPGVGANCRFYLDGPAADLEVQPGRSAVLDFLDSRTLRPVGPAAVIGEYGHGKTAFISGGLSRAYYAMEYTYARELMSGILDWMEVPRQIRVSGLTRGFESQFEVGVLSGIDAEGRRAIICLNHSDMSVHPTLALPTGAPSTVRELFTNSDAQTQVTGAELQIMTHVPEREVRVYYESAAD